MAFDLSKLNIKKLLNIANSVSNPKQGITMLLDEMAKKNPEKAKQLKFMISSGKNPEQAIMEFAQKGEINLDQLRELKQGYSLASKFGLKHKVPQTVWDKAEKAIKSVDQSGNSSRGKFSGF